MRTDRRAVPTGLLAAVLVAAVLPAQAQTGRVEVEIVPPETPLTEGQAARVAVRVRVIPRDDVPVLVTPESEGTAIEVVRGRLIRSDAVDPDADPLELPVPIIARSPGTGVLRVRVLSYACTNGRCRPVHGEASVVLRVERAGT